MILTGDDDEDVEIGYTVDDALEHAGISMFTFRVLALSTMMWMVAFISLISTSVVPDLLEFDRKLSLLEASNFVFAFCAGFFAGNFFYGPICDKYGRRKCICLAAGMSAYAAAAFSICPSFQWGIFFQALIGTNTSGLFSCSAICMELMPPRKRSLIMVISIGVPLATGYYSMIASVLQGRARSWRLVLVFAQVLPYAVCGVLYYIFMPESPRYLLATGNLSAAEEVLFTIWRQIKIVPLPGRLKSNVILHREGSAADAFRAPYRNSTLLLLYLWFAYAVAFYGSVTLVSQLRSAYTSPSSANVKQGITLESVDFRNQFFTSLGAVPFSIAAVYLLDKFGRKWVIVVVSAATAVFITPLYFRAMVAYHWLPLALIRGSTTLMDLCIIIYALEIYPTSFRATALSIVALGERLGMLVTPYVTRLLVHISVPLCLSIVLSISVVAFLLSWNLRHDTASTRLDDPSEKSKLAS